MLCVSVCIALRYCECLVEAAALMLSGIGNHVCIGPYMDSSNIVDCVNMILYYRAKPIANVYDDYIAYLNFVEI